MTAAVIVLAPEKNAPADSILLELTLHATDATPQDIILHPLPALAAVSLVVITLVAMGISDSWPVFNQVSQGVEWYQDGIKYTGTLGSGAAVFPTVGNVDQGVTYGPTGNNYSGTLKQPAISDVLTGVQYGAGGTEFTGTAAAGTGGGSTVTLRRR
jgi:hypothetical protein